MRVKNYAKGTKEKDIENGYAKPTSEVVHEFNITFESAKFKLMFASNFILSDEDRVDKIRTRIHKRFNKVCKWEIMAIDSEEETENS